MVTYTRAMPSPDEIVALYAEVYAQPPYEEGPEQVGQFRTRLLAETALEGFSVVAARDGDRLAGLAYGWTMAAGSWWSRADRQPPPEVHDSAKLAVMEWIVEPGRQGAGIGAGLLRRLLANRAESWATLASDPRSAARLIYHRAGWQQVARTTLTWGPAMDLLVLDLRRPHPA